MVRHPDLGELESFEMGRGGASAECAPGALGGGWRASVGSSRRIQDSGRRALTGEVVDDGHVPSSHGGHRRKVRRVNPS